MRDSIICLGLLFFSACSFLPRSAPTAERTTGILGRVLDCNANPAPGAFVYAYRSVRSGLRGPADFEAEVDGRGAFFLDLAPGRYYLVARSRRGGTDAGPPQAGDAWALYPGNPVTVLEGRQQRADFRLQNVFPAKLMQNRAQTAGTTGVTGRLLDASGRGVAGAFVLAYRGSGLRRMPEVTSPAVGEDGVFTLYLPTPGRWCLAARTRTRGQPAAGELYGVLAEDGGCRQVGAGEIKGIGTIVLTPRP